MADEKKRLIKVRSEKSAKFKRDGTGKKKQISDSWRKPRGLHLKKEAPEKGERAPSLTGIWKPAGSNRDASQRIS